MDNQHINVDNVYQDHHEMIHPDVYQDHGRSNGKHRLTSVKPKYHATCNFDNSLIDLSYSSLYIYCRSVIRFTEKIPSNIKKIELNCTNIETTCKDLFDDVEILHLNQYLPEITDILKTNTKLINFGCRYYDLINIDDLPQSIISLTEYNRKYSGCLDKITSLNMMSHHFPTISDLSSFPNLEYFQNQINCKNNIFYENNKIISIGFDTESIFKFVLPSVQTLHLFINLNDSANINDLNESFKFLFENCYSIRKLTIIFYTEHKVKETIFINTNIQDFNVRFLDSQIGNLNVSINGCENENHKEWLNNKWLNNESLLKFTNGFCIIDEIIEITQFNKFIPKITTMNPCINNNQLLNSIQFDKYYFKYKPNFEEYILVLRIATEGIPLNILDKIFICLLRRAQTIIPDKNDLFNFRKEYQFTVLSNLNKLDPDCRLRYYHYGFLTEKIFSEYQFFITTNEIITTFFLEELHNEYAYYKYLTLLPHNNILSHIHYSLIKKIIMKHKFLYTDKRINSAMTVLDEMYTNYFNNTLITLQPKRNFYGNGDSYFK
jgi:hypothetical protein